MYKFKISTSLTSHSLFDDLYFISMVMCCGSMVWKQSRPRLTAAAEYGIGRVVLGAGVGGVLPRTCAVLP